jgi:hypothetical protein
MLRLPRPNFKPLAYSTIMVRLRSVSLPLAPPPPSFLCSSLGMRTAVRVCVCFMCLRVCVSVRVRARESASVRMRVRVWRGVRACAGEHVHVCARACAYACASLPLCVGGPGCEYGSFLSWPPVHQTSSLTLCRDVRLTRALYLNLLPNDSIRSTCVKSHIHLP